MKYILVILLLVSLYGQAYAQNATGVISSTQSTPGSVQVQISVSETTGAISLSTSFNVNFASSTNQMNIDIKQKIRDILLQYGINIPVNNIVLFGGAQ